MPRKRRKNPFPSTLFKKAYSEPSPDGLWWVYVLESVKPILARSYGHTYVGSTNNPVRRYKQHMGVLPGGARATKSHRPWRIAAIFGPYSNRSEGCKAEYALKRRRGLGRVNWKPENSIWCRGLGIEDPRVVEGRRLLEGFQSLDAL